MELTLEEFQRKYPEACAELKREHRAAYERGELKLDNDDLSAQVKKRALKLARIEPKKEGGLTVEKANGIAQDYEKSAAEEIKWRAKALAGLRNK